MSLKSCINVILKKFNLKLISFSNYKNLLLSAHTNAQNFFDLNFLNSVKKDKKKLFKTLKYLPLSNSQFRQDLFVLNQLNFKKGGFFVEFGAADGVKDSNTFLLEKKFKWKGILAEPARVNYKKLLLYRKCKIETKIVWKDSNSELLFNETKAKLSSSIDNLSLLAANNGLRGETVRKYKLKTISLNDLLQKYGAPKNIDYLSIDTEGSEFDILNAFNFEKYKFKVITVEILSNKKKIHNLLSLNGYKNIFSNISGFDNWYVNKSIIN